MVVLKPYRAYKDSGVPALGKIPQHWEVRRQRAVVDMRVSNVDKLSVEGELPVRLCNYIDVYKNQHIRDGLDFMNATAAPEEVDRFRVRPGDVIITKDSETWTDIGVPALVECDAPDLVCGYHLAVLRPRHGVLLGDYLLRATQSSGVGFQYHVAANGVTRYGLSHEAIKNVLLPVPPIGEQAAIGEYVRNVDQRIGRHTRAGQKLSHLLQEQEKTSILWAVAGKLNPQVQRRPSGEAWLGEIPAHWLVRKIGSVARVFNGTTPSRAQSAYWEDGTIPWLASGKVNDRFITGASEFITSRARDECSLAVVPRGSVVVGLVGQGRTRGMSAILGIDATINQNLAAIVPGVNLSGRYLHYFLSAFYEPFRGEGRGGNQEALNCAVVERFPIALPPMTEQEAIGGWIEENVSALRQAQESVRYQIALLRDYRTRLIADVVTGKLDVRAAAAALPEEADLSEENDLMGLMEDLSPDGDVDLMGVEA